MKIVNVCISAPYIKGFRYQENILPNYFVSEGLECIIIGGNILPKYVTPNKVKTGIFSDQGKKLIRIKSYKITSEFLITFGLYKQLKEEKPDVIFHHNLNCTSLVICTLYRMLNKNVVLIIDNHADYINRNQNKIWQLFYYRLLVKLSAKFSSFFAQKFYGVTLLRCDYLADVYGVNKRKIEFLPIGTDIVAAGKIKETKVELKEKYNIPSGPFVFVSGGKMGNDKGTLNLISAINEINHSCQKAVLILFGSFSDLETKEMASRSKHIIFKGWCEYETSLGLLKLADVAVWPIHHTTLIEDAISVNTPLLIRKTRNTEHLIDKNGVFLHSENYNELINGLKYCIENYSSISSKSGCQKMKEKLSYKLIAQKIINDTLQHSEGLPKHKF